MSWLTNEDPDFNTDSCDAVELSIVPRTGDVGDFKVYRSLPSAKRRMVGPFIFWDQMGPGEFLTGKGLDVRPHPHIGLATVTYLFDGEIMHRDSLGVKQRITPGDINLMTAGHGIVHSERTRTEIRDELNPLFGIQSWLALPKSHEDQDPNFEHINKEKLPVIGDNGTSIKLIMGDFLGETSPIRYSHPTLYVDVSLPAGKKLVFPKATEERAVYALSGSIHIHGTDYESNQLIVLKPGRDVDIRASSDTRMMLLGGNTMDGPRHIWWNLVASDKERIEAAKAKWKAGHFPKVVDDGEEFIPLPTV